MRHRATARKFLPAGILAGLIALSTACSDENMPPPETTHTRDSAADLFDTAWQVDEIDRGGIIDRSHITIAMSDESRIAGSTGCNQYFGSLTVEATAFQVENAGSTRNACAPALMQQEQRFLQALQEVRRYEIDGEFVNLYDEAGKRRIRMIRTNEGGS